MLFRKLPTDTSKAYADVPVKKSKEEYTRAQWQIDAHGFWRSSGDRLVTKEELESVPTAQMEKVYRKYSRRKNRGQSAAGKEAGRRGTAAGHVHGRRAGKLE